MQNYELTKNDFCILDKIIKYSKLLDKHMNILYQMELEGKKNSQDYETEIRNIEMILETENNKYIEANLDGEKSICFVKYIIENICFYNMSFDVEDLIFDDGTERAIKRILIKLGKIISLDCDFQAKYPDPKMVLILLLDGIFLTKEEFGIGVKNGIVMKNAIYNDIINIILYLIEDCINDESFIYLRKELMQIKYNLSIYNEDVEKDMLKSNFVIEDFKHDSASETAKTLQIPEEAKQRIIDSFCRDITTKQIGNLLQMSDDEYELPENSKSILVRLLLMRACFIIMSDQEIEEINYGFHTLLEDSDYLEEHRYDNKAEDAIAKTFRSIIGDKEKHNAKPLVKK